MSFTNFKNIEDINRDRNKLRKENLKLRKEIVRLKQKLLQKDNFIKKNNKKVILKKSKDVKK